MEGYVRSCRGEKEGRNYATTILKHGIPNKNLKINVLREKMNWQYCKIEEKSL